MSGPALVLAAHGSSDDPRCAAPVHRLADDLRRRRAFAEVAAVFWKQPPRFVAVRDVVAAQEIVVVPVMTAAGYYVNEVLPRELARGAGDGRRVRIAPPIGVLPGFDALVADQAARAAIRAGLEPRAAAVLVAGHGTRRDPARSGASATACAEALAASGRFRSVDVGFIDQDPDLAAAWRRLPTGGPVIVAPFLVADGGHARDDVPVALGLPAGAWSGAIDGRRVVFASAAGEHAGCAELVIESARRALWEVAA